MNKSFLSIDRAKVYEYVASLAVAIVVLVSVLQNYRYEYIFLLVVVAHQLLYPSRPKLVLSVVAGCFISIPVFSILRREYHANQVAVLALVLLTMLAINLSLDGWANRRS